MNAYANTSSNGAEIPRESLTSTRTKFKRATKDYTEFHLSTAQNLSLNVIQCEIQHEN